MSEFLKIFSVFITCIFFFAKLGVPSAIVLFKYNFLKVMVVSCSGGITGATIFTYLSAGIIKWRHNFRAKRGKIHRKQIFTKFNRRIIKVKQRFGLAGIAFLTPMIGTPVGAFLAERFFKDKKKIILYLSISITFLGAGHLFVFIDLSKMAGLKHRKHLFFDLDDTLWDFERNSLIVLKELFIEFELADKLKTDFQGFYTMYKKVNLALWSQYYKKQIDKAHLRNNRFNDSFKQFGYNNYEENLLVTEQYLERSPKGTHLKEGCIETLDYLKKNYQLHIITNGFKEVQGIKLNGSGLQNYFSQIIISEDHSLTKPDTEIFRLAESFAGANPHDCVMIGDNYESDIEGALNAGWEAIYFAEENKKNYTGNFYYRAFRP